MPCKFEHFRTTFPLIDKSRFVELHIFDDNTLVILNSHGYIDGRGVTKLAKMIETHEE